MSHYVSAIEKDPNLPFHVMIHISKRDWNGGDGLMDGDGLHRLHQPSPAPGHWVPPTAWHRSDPELTDLHASPRAPQRPPETTETTVVTHRVSTVSETEKLRCTLHLDKTQPTQQIPTNTNKYQYFDFESFCLESIG